MTDVRNNGEGSMHDRCLAVIERYLAEYRHRKVDVRIIAQYLIRCTYYEHSQDFDKLAAVALAEAFDHIKRTDYIVHCDEMSEEFQLVANGYACYSDVMDSDEVAIPLNP